MNQISVTGMVLAATPIGEYDRRVVILTKERGKISAFARGARKPNSALVGVTSPFSFGEFTVYEGRTSYTLMSASISNYFQELRLDVEGAYYGFYFLEIAGYYAREANDETGLLKLLYQSLRALLNPSIPNRLARRVFELKSMVINGEYTEEPPRPVSESCSYAWEYVVCSPSESLYKFILKDDVMREFESVVEASRRYYVRHEFKSLEILDVLTG